jgi:hypothetical protein
VLPITYFEPPTQFNIFGNATSSFVEADMDEEIRRKILSILDQHRDMSIATLRPDGWPQATTVGYA